MADTFERDDIVASKGRVKGIQDPIGPRYIEFIAGKVLDVNKAGVLVRTYELGIEIYLRPRDLQYTSADAVAEAESRAEGHQEDEEPEPEPDPGPEPTEQPTVAESTRAATKAKPTGKSIASARNKRS